MKIQPVFSAYCVNKHKTPASKCIEDISKIFSIRRQQLDSKEINLRPNLFSPTIFNVFGEYDYFVVSEVLDFSFSSRYFKDFYIDRHSINNKEAYLTTGVLNSAHTFFSTYKYKDRTQNLHNKLSEIVATCPLIGITHLKLSLGAVLSKIETQEKIVKLLKSNEQIEHYFIFDSFSWNELTLILFGNSYKKILNSIDQINQILDKKTNYLVDRSETTLGYHELVDTNLIDQEDSIKVITKAKLVNGDFYSAYEKLKELFGHVFWQVGDIDFHLTQKIDPIKTRKYLQTIKDFQVKDVCKNVQLITNIVSDTKTMTQGESFSYLYKEIPKNNIIAYEAALRKCLVPTPIRDNAINLIYSINKYLLDEVTASSFIFLKASVEEHINYIIEQTNNAQKQINAKNKNKRIVNYIFALNIAISNKLQNSFHNRKILESLNLFDGDIQFPLLCLEALIQELFSEYKINNKVLVFVDSTDEISVTSDYFTLNYYHILQPEKLISVLGCELGQAILKENNSFSNIKKYSHFQRTSKDGIKITHGNQIFRMHAIKQINKMWFPKFTKKEHKDFIKRLPSTMFDHIIADCFSFKVLFQKKWELFKFWYWIDFLTISKSYLERNTLDLETFTNFYFRIRIVAEIIGEKEVIDSTFQELTKKFLNQNDLQTHIDFVEELAKTIDKNKHIHAWIIKSSAELDEFIREHKDNQNNYLQKILIRIFQLFKKDSNNFHPSYSGGLICNNKETIRELFQLRLQLYTSIWNEIAAKKLSKNQ